MAGKPTKQHGKYYSCVNKKITKNKYQVIKYPLCTDNKRIADSRWFEVQKFEAQIKEYGTKFLLSYRTETGKTELVEYTINEAVNDYIKFKQFEGLRDLTIERIEIAINHLVRIVGGSMPVSELSINHVDLFKQHYKNIHTPTTINMNLAKIITFLKWLYVRDKIKIQLQISKLRETKPLPRYISDSKWKQIMQLEKVFRKYYGLEKVNRKHLGYYNRIGEHWKRAFYFYRETGCRLIEPFIGKLEGNWLIVNANNSKTGVVREIYIDDKIICIYNEMMERFNDSKSKDPRSFSQSYSRKFKYACDTVGIDRHFHCLRHTYAVRRYLKTRDIYTVKEELGHASVTTTEIYTKFKLSKLEQDFPSILVNNKTHQIVKNHIESYTNHRTQLELESATIVGQV